MHGFQITYVMSQQASSHLTAHKNHFQSSRGYNLTHRKKFFKEIHIFKYEVLTNCMLSVRKSCVNFLCR